MKQFTLLGALLVSIVGLALVFPAPQSPGVEIFPPHVVKHFTVIPNDKSELIISTYSDSTLEVLNDWTNEILYSGKDTDLAIIAALTGADNHVAIHLKNCHETDIRNIYAFSSIYQCIEIGDALCMCSLAGDTVIGYY